ncbi:MAG: hypothetical protein EX258_00590, partial [Sphingomonadaceae bacterium]
MIYPDSLAFTSRTKPFLAAPDLMEPVTVSKPFAILAALAATSACAGSVDLDKKSTAVVVADTLPLPDVQARASSFADY